MAMHEKAKEYELYYCPNLSCDVLMYIRSESCPNCDAPRLLLRYPVDGRGLPDRSSQAMIQGTEDL